ncbi:uncharacterized protein LOC134821143 isoform X3 [Bolinopsis microptera]|uniref:uncharacterized protein LOC134821143 isoform X3 n=1 Tax=Bolinopsis microptera TaxID=2820187 RepID=UPI0030798947
MWKKLFVFCTVLLVVWAQESTNEDTGDNEMDQYLESDDFWETPKSDRKCPPGHMVGDGDQCVECPLGCYNFDGARVDDCFKCPIGTFANETGMTGCNDCESWDENRRGPFTTTANGADSSSQCVRPDEVVGDFVRATVGFKVQVKGGDFCTNIKRALWGISKVAPFDGHFYQCDHAAGDDVTSMAFEMNLPTEFAWEFWKILDMVDTHRGVGNAYIKLGRPYLNKIKEFVGGHSSLNTLDMDLDVDMMNIDDIELVEFEPYFKGDCPIAGDNSQFCDAVAGTVAATATVQRYYLRFTVPSSVDCGTNAGYVRVRNAIERSDERKLPCLTRASEKCELNLLSCEGGRVLVAFVNTFTKAENSLSFDDFQSLDGMMNFADDNIQFSLQNMFDGCGDMGVSFADVSKVCTACVPGSFLNDKGMCEKCPFGSWGEDGKKCNSCGWRKPTPFWGMEKDYCMEKDNYWKLDDKSDRDVERLRDILGENRFDLSITPEMNMCGVAQAVKALRETCADNSLETIWDDDLDFDGLKIQNIICMGSANIKKGFNELCGSDWDKSWDDIFNSIMDDDDDKDDDEDDDEDGEPIVDVICYVFKKVNDLDEADLSNDCANLDQSQYMMRMAANFDGKMNAETSAILIPILTRLGNLETMNFESFVEAGIAMMDTMGIEDMNAFTGWSVANNLKDLAFEVPAGFRMAEFDFQSAVALDEFFCANGNVKRKCEGYCDWNRCKMQSSIKEKNPQCSRDECNNCEANWFYMESDAKVAFQCDTCSFPDSITDGKLVQVSYDNVNAEYRCNEGFVSERCSTWASCEWESADKNINFPTCVEDECDWPESDIFQKWYDWRSSKDGGSCPYTVYKCNDGFMAAHYNRRVECNPSDGFRIDNNIECIARCSFPDDIDNGQKVKEGRQDDGSYWSQYKCNDGFYLRDTDWGYCETHEMDGARVAVAKVSRCALGDTCTFPDEINGARKEDEYLDQEKGTKGARYECPDNMEMEGNSWLSCKKDDPTQVETNNIQCYESKSCAFPDAIPGGKKMEEYINDARYECEAGYMMQGGDWAMCDRKNGTISYMPKCEQPDNCHLPDWIDNGYRAEKKYNTARYECDGGWSLPASIRERGGWVECEGGETKPEHPHCMEQEDDCDLPDSIDNGHRAEKEHNKARYECNIESGWKLPKKLREVGGWAVCNGDIVSPEQPKCNIFDCTFDDIPDGVKEKKGDMGMKQWYRCNDGYRMVDDHNEARCNVDGNVKYPQCIQKSGVMCDFSDVVIDNGSINEEDRNDYSIKVECDEGYRAYDGKDRMYCGVNGAITFKPDCERFQVCTYMEKIPNGYRTTDQHDGGVRYECDSGSKFEGSDWATCDTNTGTITYQPVCVKDAAADSCSLPEKIDNGYLAEKNQNMARYECTEEWSLPASIQEKGGWVWCEGSEIKPEHPHCTQDSCSLPEKIDNGYLAEKNNNMVRYECTEEWSLPASIQEKGGWVWCEGSEIKPEHPHCTQESNECRFPDVISGGRKLLEGDSDGSKYAAYMCYPPFVMTPNQKVFMSLISDQGKSADEAYMSVANIAGCYMGNVMLPTCALPEKMKHCGIPTYIENGKAVELRLRDDYDKEGDKSDEEIIAKKEGEEDMDEEYKNMLEMMPVKARYECYEGHMMHKTWDWNNSKDFTSEWGWCRKDGSYEVPRCEPRTTYSQLEFKLHVGEEKKLIDSNDRVFAGIVLARETFGIETDKEGKWQFGCNDGFNNNAAGAICRTLGFKHGAQIPTSKKMKVMPYQPEEMPGFGWTGFNCDFDDTLPKSSSCRAIPMDDAMEMSGMNAQCFDFDRIAVKCFDSAMLNVTVSLTYSNKKITCRAKANKERNDINLGAMKGIEAKFMMDETELNEKQSFNKKKGFTMKVANLKGQDFNCISCEIHVRGMMLGKAERCRDN